MIEVLSLLIVSQLLIFSVFLLSPRKSREISHVILAFFFLSLAVNLLHGYMTRLIFYNRNLSNLLLVGAPSAFLYAPLMFFYIRSLTNKPFKIRKADFVHSLPFLFFTAYLFFTFYFKPIEWKRDFVFSQKSFTFWFISTVLLNLQVASYIVAVLFMLHRYRKKIKTVFSSTEKINYSWLKFLIYGLLLLWLGDIVRVLIFGISPNLSYAVTIIFYLGFLLMSDLILYKALTQPVIFSNMEEFPQQKKKSLSDEVNEQYLQKLLSYMESEKPYLDSSLTIYKLAEKISIPPRSLSDVINNSLNKNFYDFVNSYRIKEAERLLAENNGPSKTILEILYEVGFNSKSSFNQAFKKHTGITPSYFKRRRGLSKTVN